MISELFILSEQLVPLLYKKYRSEAEEPSTTAFTEYSKKNKQHNLKPHFIEKGIHFFNIRRNGLYIVATTFSEVSPVLVIEVLSRFYHICKDFCGVVNEDSVQSNLLLVYEILDELLCQGYVQLASTEKLRPFIQSEPVAVCVDRPPVDDDIMFRMFGIEVRTVPGSASNQPVVQSVTDGERRRNEVFVDVIERMVVVINPNGTVARMEVNGSINMKNFLTGSPVIKLLLNDDLIVTQNAASKGYGNNVQLDNCSFHQCVQTDDFETSRKLVLHPAIGEFSVMTYTVSGDLSLNQPFHLLHFVGHPEGSRDVLLTLRLRCEIPSNNQAVNVRVQVPVPGSVTHVSQQLSTDGQTAEFKQDKKQTVWTIKKIPGKTEMMAQFRLISQSQGTINPKDIGPIALDFEISGYTSSGLQIKNLKIQEREKTSVPDRWVRHITVSDSYIVRVA